VETIKLPSGKGEVHVVAESPRLRVAASNAVTANASRNTVRLCSQLRDPSLTEARNVAVMQAQLSQLTLVLIPPPPTSVSKSLVETDFSAAFCEISI
jgi:hypothetical protein